MSATKIAIDTPQPHDVVCGRGGMSNNHQGNVTFRSVVQKHKELYRKCNKSDKPKVSRSIVEAVYAQDPPGRFVAKNKQTGLWYEISMQKAIHKTSQALREGNPVESMIPNCGDLIEETSEANDTNSFISSEFAFKTDDEVSMTKDENKGRKIEQMKNPCHHDHSDDGECRKRVSYLSFDPSLMAPPSRIGGISYAFSNKKRERRDSLEKLVQQRDTKRTSGNRNKQDFSHSPRQEKRRSSLFSWIIGPKPCQLDIVTQGQSHQGLANDLICKKSLVPSLQDSASSYVQMRKSQEGEGEKADRHEGEESTSMVAKHMSNMTLEQKDIDELLALSAVGIGGAAAPDGNKEATNATFSEQVEPVPLPPSPPAWAKSFPPPGMLLPETSLSADISMMAFGDVAASGGNEETTSTVISQKAAPVPLPPSPSVPTKSSPQPDMLPPETSLSADTSTFAVFASKCARVVTTAAAELVRGTSALWFRDNNQAAEEAEFLEEKRRSSLISDDDDLAAAYESLRYVPSW